MHFEIPANDIEKLKQFYEEVFGWKITQSPGPIEYWLIQTVPVDPDGKLKRPGVNGGMYKKAVNESKPINYFSVESASDFLVRLKVRRKSHQPKQGSRNRLDSCRRGSEGNQFALFSQFLFSGLFRWLWLFLANFRIRFSLCRIV
jgi:predicted enzyme related to lactoylglutathione lyase